MIHGPANASHFRVKVGRYGDRWYTDPLPACDIAPASEWQGPSVSATKPPFANKYVPMRSIAEMADSEWVRLSKMSALDRYEAIKVHDKNVGRVNMKRGSIVHQWAEDMLAGRPISRSLDIDRAALDQADRFRGPLEAFFDAYQPEPVAVEVVCLHRDLNGVGYGGTADVFASIDGAVWAIDWKSRISDHGAYLEEAAQGGAYCGAQYVIVDGGDGAAARAPIPEVAGVLIVSITEDGFRCYPIDRDGAVRAYAEMHRWWCAQQDFTKNKVIGRPWAPKIAAPTDGKAVEQPTPEPEGSASPPVPAVTRREQLRERKGRMEANAIDTGHHAEFLAQWRSFGIGKQSTDDEVEAALDAIEPPFDPDPQPTVEPTPNPQPPVEVGDGAPLDEGDVECLVEAIALSDARAVVNGWVRQGADGGHPWSPKARPHVRPFEIARAALALAEATDGHDDYARLIIATATGAELVDAARIPVGVALGALTIDEARRVLAVAEAFGERLHLIHAADGTPSLSGNVAAVLAAA